jgi:hypothetical protein
MGDPGKGGVASVIGKPIDKPWPFAKRAYFVLWVAGLVCMIASLLLDAPNQARALLDRGLRIAAIVFWIAGLAFLIRWRAKE